jgi:predicted XRE-type DNA-binding protein
MNEIWKDVKGYEGLYQVSSIGNIKRISYIHRLVANKKPKMLKQSSKGNYALITLCKDGQSKTYNVHKLVADAFLSGNSYCPLCKNSFDINHKDENSRNNFYKNLEYITHKENIEKSTSKKQKSSVKKLNDKKVIQINKLIKKNNFSYSQIGQKFNISRGLVCKIAKGRMWKHIPKI